jgi:hypothetical protein
MGRFGIVSYLEFRASNLNNQPAWLTIFDSLDILRAAVFL